MTTPRRHMLVKYSVQGTYPRGRGGKEINNLASRLDSFTTFSDRNLRNRWSVHGRACEPLLEPTLASIVKGLEIGAQAASHLDHPAGIPSTTLTYLLQTRLVVDMISVDRSQGLVGGLQHVLQTVVSKHLIDRLLRGGEQVICRVAKLLASISSKNLLGRWR